MAGRLCADEPSALAEQAAAGAAVRVSGRERPAVPRLEQGGRPEHPAGQRWAAGRGSRAPRTAEHGEEGSGCCGVIMQGGVNQRGHNNAQWALGHIDIQIIDLHTYRGDRFPGAVKPGR